MERGNEIICFKLKKPIPIQGIIKKKITHLIIPYSDFKVGTKADFLEFIYDKTMVS